MVTARYLFGWWFVKFVSFIGCLGGTGWSIVNCVLGGQILAAVSDNKVPLWVGILIVAVVTLVVALFGIKIVLAFEKYLALPVFIAFLLMYISASDKYYLLNTYESNLDPSTHKGSWLSFFSLTYSVTATWGTVCSDYYIQFPEDTPSYQTFLLTFFGIAVPSTFVAVLGLIVSTLTMVDDSYAQAYDSYGTGGILLQAFARWNGFGKFCIIVLLFSLVSNNIVNTYSSAFAFQLVGLFFARIPRWVWVILITVIYFVCSLAGRDHFSEFLGNFLPMIGYWISMYFFLLLEENMIFRRYFHHLYTKEFPDDDVKESAGQTYNWSAWNDYTVLTHGVAAGIAFCCGIGGAVCGMAQVYFIGPVAKHFGEYGGDVGMWLSMAFCGVVYPALRYFELKKFGR
jgi:NCS1 nucleoside transporter family